MRDRRFLRVTGTMVLLSALLVITPHAHAVNPTEIEPAEPYETGTLVLELKSSYAQYNRYESNAETNLEYGITDKLGVRLHAPVEFNEHEDTEFDDLGLRLKYVFNPEAEKAPVFAVLAEAFLPTGEDSSGVGGEVKLTMSKALGSEAKNKLHLTLSGDYNNDTGDDERDFYYEAAAGYSYRVSDNTTLIADFVRKQLETHGENANIFELGVKHAFSDSVSGALGAGVGIGEESPDLTLKGGLEFRFGIK